MSQKPRYTFHYTPEEYFNSQSSEADYVPPHFDAEGFIHTTEGAQNMADTGNRHYKDDNRPFLVLYIDKTRIKSPVVYEDPNEMYPHIYGPLNRDAIVRIIPAPRSSDGTFLPMPEMEDQA